MERYPLSSPQYHQKAVEMADANPQSALVYAVLALANAVDHIGSDTADLVKMHERVATEIGGVASALNGIGDEIAHFTPVEAE